MPAEKVAAKILLFHGISSTSSYGIENYSKKHLPLDDFRTEIIALKNQSNIIPLRELVSLLKSQKSLPPNSVAITFDDSFKSIYTCAFPLLKQYDLPATFFITTGFVETSRYYWVDLVEHSINLTSKSNLTLPLNGHDVTFPICSPEEKIWAVTTVKRLLKKLLPLERDQALAELQEQTNVNSKENVPNYSHLSWDDVLSLDSPPQFEVGGHSVNHEILSYLSQPALHFEVWECKRHLEEHLNHHINLFAYPEGQQDHFNEEVIRELKSAGITICPTAIPGVNYPGTDPFHLKRIRIGRPKQFEY